MKKCHFKSQVKEAAINVIWGIIKSAFYITGDIFMYTYHN